MRNFMRYWNQNRKKIMIIIAIIAFIIILIQTINNLFKSITGNDSSTRVTDRTKPIQSVISGEKVSEEKTEENTKTIKDFVKYCNNKQYKEAYLLLSEDCKAEFNNDVNVFKTKYCDEVFSSNKTYELELWMNTDLIYTYRIKYYANNMLATGSSNLEDNIEDYMTLIKENGENRLSLNGFILKQNINKSTTVENINIIINSRKVYRDYEEYNITIENNSDKEIMISNGEKNKDICLVDNNNSEYNAFLNEIPIEVLSLKSQERDTIAIRFNKIYNIYRNIAAIRFKNIITDIQNQDSVVSTNINI